MTSISSESQRDAQPLGLRERKKLKTRATIESRALALIRTKGYEATTVQEIAEAAEVSESTFFRYFPSKADVVMWDQFDPVIIAAYRAQPSELGPIDALRRAIREAFGSLSDTEMSDERERTSLAFTVPELRAVMLDQLVDPQLDFNVALDATLAELQGKLDG
jgi:AcrR family transcriptional regulator